MFPTKVLKIAVLLAIATSVNAQEKYWIYYNDTTQNYLSSIGLHDEYSSSWLKAGSYYLTQKERFNLKISGIDVYPVQAFSTKSTKDPEKSLSLNNGFALDQIEGEVLIQKGLTGEGIKIGIIDGGFFHANEDPSLRNFFEKDRIAGSKNYLFPDKLLYEGGKEFRDTHGREVWQLIGGKNLQKGIQYGLATEATYYLACTDHDAYEKRVEEDYLIAAMEWMAKEGVKIINISLGYNIGFNRSDENYLPEQMDG